MAQPDLFGLREFLRLCTGCEIDSVPIHWHDPAPNVAYFTNYVQEAYNAAGGDRSGRPRYVNLSHPTLRAALEFLA
ncbi:hypothetical protein BKA65DRAFT_509484, partial [Rhexocercosporidium sp. MPI-PUGE-AT-0058]